MKITTKTSIAALLLCASTAALAQQVPVIPAECSAAGNNCSVVTQNGSNATVTNTQSGSGNTAVVAQTVTRGAVSTIEQPGTLNFADVEQIDDGTMRSAHRSTVEQGGNENIAFVLQNERGNSIGQLSDIEQSGNSNYADVAQTGFADQSSVTQSSDLNSAIVTQDTQADGTFSNVNQISTVIQAGTGGHSAVVNQVRGLLGISYIEQQGDSNTATVSQIALRQDAEIIQTGNENMATVTQGLVLLGPGENSARIEQIGDLNRSTITQVQSASSNNATSTQSGDMGMSTITQSNSRNNATLDQLLGSSDATSTIAQSGNDNISSVEQGGLGDASSIMQNGNGNMATVRQNVP